MLHTVKRSIQPSASTRRVGEPKWSIPQNEFRLPGLYLPLSF
jgi:hypothetical protein